MRKLNRHKRTFLEERKTTEELSRAHNKFDESPFLARACPNTAWSSKELQFLNCVFDNLVNGLLIGLLFIFTVLSEYERDALLAI